MEVDYLSQGENLQRRRMESKSPKIQSLALYQLSQRSHICNDNSLEKNVSVYIVYDLYSWKKKKKQTNKQTKLA